MVFPRQFHSSIRVSMSLTGAAVRSADLIGTITAVGRAWRARRAVTARRGSQQRSDSRRASAGDGCAISPRALTRRPRSLPAGSAHDGPGRNLN